MVIALLRRSFWSTVFFLGCSLASNAEEPLLFRHVLATANSLQVYFPGFRFAGAITTSTGGTTICQGNSLVLRANPSPPVGSTYQWTKDNVAIAAPAGTASTLTVNTTGSYGLTVTTANVPEIYPAIGITVLAVPVTGFTHSADNQCASSPMSFSNTSTGTGLTYKWDFGDPNSGTGNNTSTVQNPSHKFVGNAGNGSQTYRVTLTVTNNSGCTALTSQNVTTLQRPSTELAGNNLGDYNGLRYFKECASVRSTLTFADFSTTSNSHYTIKWGDGSANFDSNAFPAEITHAFDVGDYTLTYTVTGVNGCTDTEVYHVFVGGTPAITFGTTGNNSICTGSTLTFQVGHGDNPPGTTYTVTYSDGFSKIYNTPPDTVSHTFLSSSKGETQTAGPTVYNNAFAAFIKASNPCGTTSASVVPIYVSAKPNAKITTSPADSVCVGTTQTFTNANPDDYYIQPDGTSFPNKFTWQILQSSGYAFSGDLGKNPNNPNFSLRKSGSESISLTYTTAGSYTVKLKSANPNCGQDSILKTVCVNPIPTASFNVDNATGCMPLAVKTTNTSALPICGNNKYLWTVTYVDCSGNSSTYNGFANGTNKNSVNPELQLTNAGSYIIKLTTIAPGGRCTETINKTIIVKSKPSVTITSGSSICQGNSYTPAAVVSGCNSGTPTYVWTMTGAAPSTSTAANPGPITFAAAGIYTIKLDVTNDCGTTTQTKTVTVNETPTVTTPADQQICASAFSGPLNFTSSAGTTFKWTNSSTAIGLAASGNGNIGSFKAINSTLTPIVANIIVTPTNGSCPGQPATFKITVYPIPAPPVADAVINYCINDIPTKLTANASAGNTLTWYNNAALTGGSTTAPTPATTAASATKYYVTQSNGGNCASPATIITINVNPAIENNTIGSDQALCANTAATALKSISVLSGGSGTYTYQWQSSADGASWSDITGATAVGYSPGNMTTTTQYRRLVTSGSCSSTSNSVKITVQGSLSNFNISANQTICPGDVPQFLKGQQPSGASGSFTYQWESSVDNNTFSPINGAVGIDYQPASLQVTNYYRRTTFGGTCNASSNTVTVTVNPKPVVNPISDKLYCNASPSAIIAFGPTLNTTFTWANDNTAIGLAATGSGNLPSFTTNNATKAPVTATITVTPTYTSGGASCTGTPMSFKITILPTISVNAVSDQLVCAGSTNPATALVNDAAAFPGGTVVYSWVSSSSVGLNNGTGSQVPSFSAVNSGNSDLNSTVTLTPEYTYQGQSCSGVPISYKVTVYAKPTTALAGSNDKTCNTTYTLQGNVPVTGTGTWTQTAGPASTFSAANSGNNTVSNLTQGARYQFSWTIVNGSCSPSTSPVTIDVLNDIVNTVKADAPFICPGQSATISTASLSGGDILNTLPATYTYAWESSPDGAGNWATISGATQASLNVAPSATTYYRRKVKSYGLCEFASNTIAITLNSTAPVAKAGSNQTLCAQTQTRLQGNDPGAGFVGTWTGNGLTFSPDAHAYNATVSGLLPGQSYTLTWTIASSSCGFSASTVTIHDLLPLTNQLSPGTTTVCVGQPATLSGSLPSGASGNYTYAWESSTDQNTWSGVSGQTQQNSTVLPSQSTYYRRLVFSGNCSLASGTVQVIVLPAISNNVIDASQQVCILKPVTALNGSLPAGGDGTYQYQWQQSGDQSNWTNIANATGQGYQPPPLSSTTYYRRIVTSAMCTGNQQNISAVVTVTVNPNAKAEFSASALKGCIPFDLSKAIKVIPHDELNSQYQWYANGTAIGTGSAFPGYTIQTDGSNVTIELIATSKFGCDASSISMTFTTTKSVIASFTKDQTRACGPLLTRFTNTSAPIGGATYHWDFGDGQTSSLEQPGQVVFQPNPSGRDTTYKITLTASTACSNTTFVDSVTVRSRPKAIFTPDQTIGCSPFTVHITNQSTGLPNRYTFSFGNGDKIVQSDNQAIQYTYTTLKTDTLIMKLVAENECGKDSSFYKIVVYPNSVKANLVVNGDNKFGCAPFAVKFDNNSTGANNFKYDFGDGNTATTTAAPESVFHTFTVPGTYVVKLTASNGCSTQSTTQTIVVLAQPNVSFHPAQLQYCVGNAAAFVNTTVNASSFDYSWDFGDGTTSNDFNPTHVYAKLGTYAVKVTAVQNAANGATCGRTVSGSITILPLPVATFNSNSASLNCAPFRLTVSSTPANAPSVSWSFGDAGSNDNTATGYAASHNFDKPGLYLVKLLAYNQSGCVDSTTQVVRVTETPAARFTVADSVICGNTASVKFVNGSTYGGNDLVNYKWYVNGAYISAQKDLNYNFNTPGNVVLPYIFHVRLIAYSTIGCPDTVEHTMQFNPLPVAKFTVPASISCAPFSLKINNSSQYADGFKWYVNNTLVSTDKTPQITLPEPNKAYLVKLVTSNIYGCGTDSTISTFSTYPSPIADFSLADSVSCNGKLDIKVTNNTTGASSYTWNFGDGSPEQSSRIPVHTYGIPGTYILRLVTFNGTCRDTAMHQVNIANPPKAAFVANILKGCTSIRPVFQNTSLNASAYLWDFGDGTFSAEKNPAHSYTYTGSPYTVKLTVYGEFGCEDNNVLVNYITVSAPPVVDFAAAPDSVIQIPNYTFSFKNQTTGSVVKYAWDFGDGKTSAEKDPIHTYKEAGTYAVKLTVTNTDGCTASRTRTVKVATVEQYLYVPNAFEPGSAKSELQTFTVRAAGLVSYSLRIFNKWGQLLFETTALDSNGSPTVGWTGDMKGQPAPLGVYVWQISGRFLDGTEWHGMKYKAGDKPSQTGILHLIR